MPRIKSDWTAKTLAQVVAALARRGFDRASVRDAANLAYAQGYANVDSTDNSTRALIRWSHTECETYDAHTFALPVNRVEVPAETLVIGSVFYLVGSNGVGKYRVTSVRHTPYPGRIAVAVDWQSVTTDWNQGGKGWNAGDLVTIDAGMTPGNAYVPSQDVTSGHDAQVNMSFEHTVPLPRMKPAQRDTRYPAGSWVWDHVRKVYAQVLRTPDLREPSLVLYVPPITDTDDEGYTHGVIVAPAVTYCAPRSQVFPGVNVSAEFHAQGAASVTYARREVPVCEACGASVYGGNHDCQAPGRNIARAGDLGNVPVVAPQSDPKPFTVGAMRDAMGPILAARYVPAGLSDDLVIPEGYEVTDAGIVGELTDAWVCATCAYAIGYAEWPGDWSEDETAERDAQVSAYAGDVRFVVDIDGMSDFRDDTCAYHGQRFAGEMYPVSRTRVITS